MLYCLKYFYFLIFWTVSGYEKTVYPESLSKTKLQSIGCLTPLNTKPSIQLQFKRISLNKLKILFFPL